MNASLVMDVTGIPEPSLVLSSPILNELSDTKENRQQFEFMVQDGDASASPTIEPLQERSSEHDNVLEEGLQTNNSTIDDAADFQDPDWVPEPYENNDPQNLKRPRRKIAEPNEWMDAKNRKLRCTGEGYIGWTKVDGKS